MANKTCVTIVLRKEVNDVAAAQVVIDAVKAKVQDRPDIKVSSSINISIED